jgi:hypothetical protein
MNMKKRVNTAIMIFSAFLTLAAFTYTSGSDTNPPQEKAAAVFPEEVQKILETSCFDCHSDASSNVKSKGKLNFSKWGDLSDTKKVGKMEAINEEIKEGNMPPEKYVSKYPDHALTQEGKDLINQWVTTESAKLMGK